MTGTPSSINATKSNQTRALDGLNTLIRWVLSVVFIFAGATKLAAPESFAVLIDAYGIVPEELLMPIAWILPMLEVAAGIGFLFNIQGSLTVITTLLMLFIAILVYGLWMGLDVDCGCFGPEDPEAAFHGIRTSLYRDLVMLAGVIFIFFWHRHRAIIPLKFKSTMRCCFKQRRSTNGS